MKSCLYSVRRPHLPIYIYNLIIYLKIICSLYNKPLCSLYCTTQFLYIYWSNTIGKIFSIKELAHFFLVFMDVSSLRYSDFHLFQWLSIWIQIILYHPMLSCALDTEKFPLVYVGHNDIVYSFLIWYIKKVSQIYLVLCLETLFIVVRNIHLT